MEMGGRRIKKIESIENADKHWNFRSYLNQPVHQKKTLNGSISLLDVFIESTV